MKIKLLTILLLIVCLSPRAYSQEERIIFSDRNTTVKDIVDQIQGQTRYLVSMNNENLSPTKKIGLSHNNLTLKEVMSQLTDKTGNTFLIQGRYIVVYPVKNKTLQNKSISPTAAQQQQLQQQAISSGTVDKGVVAPVDVDSLTRALNARKTDFPAEIPPKPELNTNAYYMQRDKNSISSTIPNYTNSMPKWALRTNLLYAAATLTPNIGAEIALNKKSTLLITGSYNGWKADENNAKLNHWLVGAEYRRWFCEVFNGHFYGIHGFYGHYNISGKNVPFVFDSNSEDYRYIGNVMGLGVSYGYQFMLGRGWNLELNVGVGAGLNTYDKYNCPRCGDLVKDNMSKWFVAPTKLGVSLVYIIK